MRTKTVRPETFREFMKRKRGSRTKKEIADLLDVSYVYITLMEKGDRYPPPARLEQICKLFDEPYQKWKRTIDWELETDKAIKEIKAYDVLYNWYDERAPLRLHNRDGLEITINSPTTDAETVEYDRPQDKTAKRPDSYRMPILSLAQCGKWTEYTDADYPPGFADEYAYSDSSDPNAFFVRAEGLSMTRAGIDSGDLLLVEPARTNRIHNGSIVLAITDQGQTVKRFYDAGEVILLQPEGTEGETLTIEKKPKDPPDCFYPVTEIRKIL